ncbi:MAG TPA: hypothetical protein VNT54_07325 [Solirubrobacteraceae bacterium]|nr:hypothetical protein [Solirubrobacteraceae bacterium]
MIGPVPGRAGKRLAALERRVQAAREHHREVQREQLEAQEAVARLDERLQALEAEQLAGRKVDVELKGARSQFEGASRRADEPWPRRVAVAEGAVRLLEQERAEFAREQFPELNAALWREAIGVRGEIDASLVALQGRIGELRDLHQRQMALLREVGGDTRDVDFADDLEPVRRAIREVVEQPAAVSEVVSG